MIGVLALVHAAAEGWSGGTQPPFTHVHPLPGALPAHPEHDVVAGGGGVGSGGGEGAGGGAPLVGHNAASGCPGGTQPPFTQIHALPGELLLQPEQDAPGLGAGAGDGLIAGGGAGCGAPAEHDAASGWPGGTHPPFTHVHPLPGEIVVQPLHVALMGVGVGAGTGVTSPAHSAAIG